MGCGITYTVSRMFRFIRIALEYHQMTNLIFCRANGTKTLVKDVLIPVQSLGSPEYTIPCHLEISHNIRCTGPGDV